METIENNKLIAEFLGVQPNERGEYEMFGVIESIDQDDQHFYTTRVLKFNDSWDWLIPAIKSIYTLEKYYDYVQENSSMISDGQIRINPFSIDKTHYNVVEFIKWYNENKH